MADLADMADPADRAGLAYLRTQPADPAAGAVVQFLPACSIAECGIKRRKRRSLKAHKVARKLVPLSERTLRNIAHWWASATTRLGSTKSGTTTAKFSPASAEVWPRFNQIRPFSLKFCRPRPTLTGVCQVPSKSINVGRCSAKFRPCSAMLCDYLTKYGLFQPTFIDFERIWTDFGKHLGPTLPNSAKRVPESGQLWRSRDRDLGSPGAGGILELMESRDGAGASTEPPDYLIEGVFFRAGLALLPSELSHAGSAFQWVSVHQPSKRGRKHLAQFVDRRLVDFHGRLR